MLRKRGFKKARTIAACEVKTRMSLYAGFA
jgi:hypothetical protein